MNMVTLGVAGAALAAGIAAISIAGASGRPARAVQYQPDFSEMALVPRDQAMELAVPKAASLMADWGADVTWLENTGAGDTIRDTPWIKEAERRNQRSVALDFFSQEGREVLLKMLGAADVFIESSKGGTWAKRGLTDEVLRRDNPELVIVHVSGFGQTGVPEMVSRAAYDLTVMAYSGYMSQNGTPEQPMNPGPYAGDYFNSLMILGSTLAALHGVDRTGVGESVDVAMYETLLSIGQYYLVDYLNAGIVWPRPGARNQNLCAIGTPSPLFVVSLAPTAASG